jgi:hypothetical protein
LCFFVFIWLILFSPVGDAGKAVDKIEQRIIWTSEGKKHQLLSQLLAEGIRSWYYFFCR